MFTGQIETAKVDVAEFERLKRFFMRLEIIAHAKEDFDIHDHFNEKDIDYSFLFQFQNEGEFDFQGFIEASIKEIGTGFSRVINGYEELVEKYCDPESLVLEPIKAPYEKQLDIYFKTILDNVEYSFREFYEKSPVEISAIRFYARLEYWAMQRPGIFTYPVDFNDHLPCKFKIVVPPVEGFNKETNNKK